MTKPPAPPQEVHGTWQGREQFGCSCDPCQAVWSMVRGTFIAAQIGFDKAYEPILAETGFPDIFALALAGRRGR